MRHYFVLLFLAVTLSCSAKQGVSQQTDNKHTFVVDENLPAPEKNFEILSGELIAKQWASENKVNKTIAYSFENEDLCNLGQDNFFKCMVQAYAGHHSVILSPDIIWNVIAQGFSQHVNNNPEALRDRIVYHEKGKITLSVITKEDLHSPNVKWDELLDTFEKQITENTKDNLADVMRADFSTTDKTARIVSQMTLMSSVKSFLNYEIHYLCGIPSITIEGKVYEVEILDTAGEEDYQNMMDMWISFGEGFLLVFAINDYESFELLKGKYERILKGKHGTACPILLVGNKQDLANERKVQFDEAKKLADSWKINYMETSAKTNFNCKEAFESLAAEIVKSKNKEDTGPCCPCCKCNIM